jgi:hypothetical protein
MVDFHRHNSHRLPGCREGHFLLLQRLGRFAVSSDPKPAKTYFHFDLVGLYASQFDADSKAGHALENVDWRTPLNAGIMKIREMDLGDLVGNLANLPFENTETKRSGFLAHEPQWTQWPNDATVRVQELAALRKKCCRENETGSRGGGKRRV